MEKIKLMYKNFVKVAFVAAVAMVAGINVFNAQKTELMSDIAMENVEALADNESDSDLAKKQWNRYDYTLDNGMPAVNCWKKGEDDCLLK